MTPIDTAPLFGPLHAELLALLRALPAADWQRPTVAGRWLVRDVAAHLLDGDLRKIAVYRDGHFLPLDAPMTSAEDLLRFISGVNATGVDYARRLSPRLLVDLLEVTGAWVTSLIADLPLHGRSISGQLGRRRPLGELDGHRARVHRALASPDADSRCGRRAAGAAGAALDDADARHRRVRVAAGICRGLGATWDCGAGRGDW
jgi:hypothetical protein